MPEAQPQPKPKVKGKPGGLPTWAWIIGAVAGLIIGYMIYKKSGGSSSGDISGVGSSSPLGTQDTGSGGGVVASPPPGNSTTDALGLTHSGTSDPGTIDSTDSGSNIPDISTSIYIPASETATPWMSNLNTDPSSNYNPNPPPVTPGVNTSNSAQAGLPRHTISTEN
jgi:hypothetical protein